MGKHCCYVLLLFIFVFASDKSEKEEQFMISMIDLVINNSLCKTLSFLCFLISLVKTNVFVQELQAEYKAGGRIVTALAIISELMWVNTAKFRKGFINIISCQVGKLIEILNPFPLSTKVGVVCPNFKLR